VSTAIVKLSNTTLPAGPPKAKRAKTKTKKSS
jgi:hypothetical protein